MGVAASSRDPETVRAGLTRWLAARYPDARDLQVGPLSSPADGLSSATYFVEVTSRAANHSLVARLPPVGDGLFPAYDLEFQARIQEIVSGLGVPVARPIAYVGDASWIGTPFMVMPRIAGRIPSDSPPYQLEGWLHDATVAHQESAFCGFLDVLADIHRLDWRHAGLEGTARSLSLELDWWAHYVEWASDGSVPAELAESLVWCRQHLPRPEPPSSLLWGDVRLGNVIFGDDFLPAAVLDWEMASVGPAEIDLGWFFALRARRPELPGFLDRDNALARYSHRLGRPIGDLWWYELFALVRSTAILLRTQRLLVEQGQSDHWLVGFDPVPKRVRSFLAGI